MSEILSQENPMQRILDAFMRASNPFQNLVLPYTHASAAARQSYTMLTRAGLSPF